MLSPLPWVREVGDWCCHVLPHQVAHSGERGPPVAGLSQGSPGCCCCCCCGAGTHTLLPRAPSPFAGTRAQIVELHASSPADAELILVKLGRGAGGLAHYYLYDDSKKALVLVDGAHIDVDGAIALFKQQGITYHGAQARGGEWRLSPNRPQHLPARCHTK